LAHGGSTSQSSSAASTPETARRLKSPLHNSSSSNNNNNDDDDDDDASVYLGNGVDDEQSQIDAFFARMLARLTSIEIDANKRHTSPAVAALATEDTLRAYIIDVVSKMPATLLRTQLLAEVRAFIVLL
jgi:hypothetical protein